MQSLSYKPQKFNNVKPYLCPIAKNLDINALLRQTAENMAAKSNKSTDIENTTVPNIVEYDPENPLMLGLKKSPEPAEETTYEPEESTIQEVKSD